MVNAFAYLRPFIHSLPPETAHNMGLLALKLNLLPNAQDKKFSMLETKTLGLTFPNPVGLAAGFDKNAIVVNALLKKGFGFVEAGTVTPMAQKGNPKPRIFRLVEDKSVINRLGFNNNGLENFIHRFRGRNISLGIAGANIGRNKNATDAVEDYVKGLEAVYAFADYITVNISSPNTQGLRSLQQRESLNALLSALSLARSTACMQHGRRVPLLLKIAPDLDAQEKKDIVEAVFKHSLDGLIVSNTTVSRPTKLKSQHADETGGLSGQAVYDISTQCLKDFYSLTQGKLPLIGVGGIASAQDAYSKIRAGATLVQLYTALVYSGFAVVQDIQNGLEALLAKDGFTHVLQAVGIDA